MTGCKVQILFPKSAPPTTPNLVSVVATAISGPANDTVVITFDEPMSTGGGANDCDNLANWTVESPDGSALALGGATTISAVGDPTVVTITLADTSPDDDNLQFGDSVRVTLTNTSVATTGGISFDDSSGLTTVTTTVVGDNTGPTVTSVTQNRTVDSTGQTIDVLFNEAVNETSAETIGNYTVSGGQGITSATLQPDGVTVRLVLDALAYPLTHTIDISNVDDLAGNPGGGSGVSIGSTDSTAPSVTSATQNRTVDTTGFTVDVLFDDQLEQTSAETTGNYTLSGGQTVLSATLQGDGVTVRLVLDALAYPPTHTIDVANVNDIAGNTASASGVAIGSTDSTAPTVTSVTQNRTVDSTGQTVDVLFSDRMYQPLAETTGNYTPSGGQNVTSATLQPDRMTVRVVLDALAFPPTHTLDVGGVTDIAGNGGSASGAAITSDDSTAPGVVTVAVGSATDEVVVTFDDDMFPSDVTAAAAYTFESPTGNSVTLNTPGTWDSGAKTVTFTAATSLTQNDTFTITFVGTNRDIAGNQLVADPFSGTVSAQTWNVPGDFATIQEALDAAGNGDVILVAPGTYTGTNNTNLDWGGKDVSVIGTGGSSVTIIDVQNSKGDRGIIFDDGESSAAVLDGFTVINGWADQSAGRAGGGMLVSNDSSPTIRNCVFRNNLAQGPGPTTGGGVAVLDSSPTFEDCEFHTNTAAGLGANSGQGGGVHVGASSPASAAPTFTSCLFYSNTAESGEGDAAGGGVSVTGDATTVTLINCSIYSNTVTTGGTDDFVLGGGLVVVDSGDVTFTHGSVSGNSAQAADVGVNVYGGGVYTGGGATASFTNAIIWSNSADDGGAQLAADDGSTPGFTTASGAVSLSFCDYGTALGDVSDPGTVITASNSFSQDPLYTDLGNGDLTLDSGSPCVNNGTDAGVTDDQDDVGRPQSGDFDIGEFEQ